VEALDLSANNSVIGVADQTVGITVSLMTLAEPS
jgi:hypothetical protein